MIENRKQKKRAAYAENLKQPMIAEGDKRTYAPSRSLSCPISDTKRRRVLQTDYVLCLKTLWSLLHFEFYRLTFVQALVAVSLNRREMHEHILTGLALNEPKTLCRVEPLHCSLFFSHFCCS